MENKIVIDFTAINTDGQGSFAATYYVGSRKEVAEALRSFEDNCPFKRYEKEAYAEHENGDEITEEERGWFTELEISL